MIVISTEVRNTFFPFHRSSFISTHRERETERLQYHQYQWQSLLLYDPSLRTLPTPVSRLPVVRRHPLTQKQSLGLRAAKFATEKYHDRIYDKLSPPKDRSKDTLDDTASSDDSDSAAYSDNGTAHRRHKERGRRRRGTSDGLGERAYPDPWSGYAPNYAPRAEYGTNGTARQTTWPQPVSQRFPCLSHCQSFDQPRTAIFPIPPLGAKCKHYIAAIY